MAGPHIERQTALKIYECHRFRGLNAAHGAERCANGCELTHLILSELDYAQTWCNYNFTTWKLLATTSPPTDKTNSNATADRPPIRRNVCEKFLFSAFSGSQTGKSIYMLGIPQRILWENAHRVPRSFVGVLVGVCVYAFVKTENTHTHTHASIPSTLLYLLACLSIYPILSTPIF